MSAIGAVSLMECLGDIEDPRRPSNGTLHDLREIPVIAICATLSNVDNFDDIAFWARSKETWLRRFLLLEHGIAISELIDALCLKGHLVSVDAMGCQKDIAAHIIKKKGDYLLAVKGNQPGLLQKVEDAVIDRSDLMSGHERVDPTHGRLVVQWSRVLPARGIIALVVWPKCKTIGVVDSLRKIGDKSSSDIERRYYISSRELSAEDFALAVRSH